MVASLGGIGALVGGASSLAGLLGFGSTTPQSPNPTYMPQNLPGADAGAFGGIQGLNPTIAGATGAAGSIANNPYAPGYQAGANAIAPYATGAGANLLATGQSYLPYAQQTLQTGFDPQNALYTQQYQQNNDAVNSGLASRGLGMTPYGAGVQNQSDINFNNQWQNQQLARQGQAAQTVGALSNAGGAATTLGLNTLQQGAALPYSTANTIGQTGLSAYGTLAGIQNPQIADYLQYLGVGNQSAGVNNQLYANQITAQNNQFNQMQTAGSNLGKSLSGAGNFFGGGSGVAPYSSSGNPVTYGSYGGISFPQYT